MDWQNKANRLIKNLCTAAYRRTNPNTGLAYRHRPYTPPAIVKELIDCLDTNDELRAKEIFLSYDGLKATEGDRLKS